MIPRSLIPALLIGLIGLVFVLIGAGINIFGPRSVMEHIADIESLPVVSSGSVRNRAIDSRILIEGTIAVDNPTLFREYVAYIREEYRGTDSDDDPIWSEDERRTPALLIALSGGTAQLANTDYRLTEPLVHRQEPDILVWNGITGEGTHRYEGIVAGSRVTVVGRVVRGSEDPEFAAEFVAGGTRAEYLEQQRRNADSFGIVGLIIGGVGSLFAIGGFAPLIYRMVSGQHRN
jgi:hypothetical protein